EVGDAAAVAAGAVSGEGAADHRRRPEVLDAAAAAVGAVSGEGAADHRRRRATLVVKAAAAAGEVAGENAVADRQRPEVVKAAAVVGIASRDRQAGDVHGGARIDSKEAEGGSGGIPLNRQVLGSRPLDGNVVVQGWQSTG